MPRPRKRIPKSSVFSEYRKLPKVGQSFTPDDDWEYAETTDTDRLDEAIPEGHELRRYFGFSQNDATVIDCKFESQIFILTLSHHDITNLACVWMNWNWNDAQTYFPVELHFVGVREQFVLRAVEQGSWQTIRNSRRELTKCLRDIRFLEMNYFESGKIHSRLSLHGQKPFERSPESTRSWYMNEYSIFVDCESIEIQENLRENWASACGEDSLDLFDAFFAACPMCRLGYPDLGDWIRDFERSRGKNLTQKPAIPAPYARSFQP